MGKKYKSMTPMTWRDEMTTRLTEAYAKVKKMTPIVIFRFKNKKDEIIDLTPIISNPVVVATLVKNFIKAHRGDLDGIMTAGEGSVALVGEDGQLDPTTTKAGIMLTFESVALLQLRFMEISDQKVVHEGKWEDVTGTADTGPAIILGLYDNSRVMFG